MLVEVIAGAVLSLVILAAVIALVLKRAPAALVADKLPEDLYSGDGEAGRDRGEPNEYE